MTDEPATRSILPGGGPTGPPEPESFQLRAGDQVGNYVIREQLGEGGFAVVYAADQEKPVRRKVAVKIIKLGMDTKQVIARFEAERQALAMMDHPNVAKVFDAGTTERGRPYFVMEYVAGTPITSYCDRQRLAIEDRLHLFIQVCDAVQHAHQKGIIHRDIKPSNVLVAVKEGEPVVKVIDFGVAKAITQRLTEKTIYTGQGQLIGTPEYMSPEQAEMTRDDIDTRSDVYSLGVLLYELLTGDLPFDRRILRAAGFAEIQRIIREEEPPKPSTRLGGLGDASTHLANQRRGDVRSLVRDLRGDLDWITMRALEKDRVRRYATVSELADDIKRHRRREPVLARRPSTPYRLRRFVARQRLLVGAVASVFIMLVAGVVSTAIALNRAIKAEQEIRADSEKRQLLYDKIILQLILTGTYFDIVRHEGGSPKVKSHLADAWAGYTDSSGKNAGARQFARHLAATDNTDALRYLRAIDQLLLANRLMRRADFVHPSLLEPRGDESPILVTERQLRWDIQPAGMTAEQFDAALAGTRADLAVAYKNLGRDTLAESHFSGLAREWADWHETLETMFGHDDQRTVWIASSLADLFTTWGKPMRAARWRRKLPPGHPAAAPDMPAIVFAPAALSADTAADDR